MSSYPAIAITAAELNSVGGLHTYIQNLALGLKGKGWAVHLIATNNRGDYFHKLSQVVNCYDLSMLPLTRKKVYAAAELLQEIAPDVLIMNHSPLLHYCLPLISTKIKPIALLHSNDPRFYRIATSFSSRVFRWIAPTVALAETCKKYLHPHDHMRIRVVPHGIDDGVFFADAGSLHETTRSIIFVGSLDVHKGVDLVPEIFKVVLKQHPDIKLNIVGKGPSRLQLETRFKELGIASSVKFLGSLTADELAGIYRKTDVLLLPTRIEGFGLAIAEAMMCGVVPIVTNLRGITDQLVENGKTGFLVDQDHITGFAGAASSLFSDVFAIEKMKAAASDRARQQFSRGQMLESYEKLFAENDDRRTLRRRSTVGWMYETLSELMRKDVDGTLPLRHLGRLIKRPLLRAVGRQI